MKKYIITLGFISFLIFSCNNTKKASENISNNTSTDVPKEKVEETTNSQENSIQDEKGNAMTNENNILASIRRTACFGKCPVFEMIIYKDGSAEYEGTGNVSRMGKYNATVSQEIMDDILEKAKSIGYFDLKDEYNNPRVMDVPSTYTTIGMGDSTKSVFARFEVPAGLLRFQDYLESVVDKIEWNLIEKYDNR